MAREDHQAFGPEWQVALQLPLLELPPEDVTFVGDFPARLAQLFPECLSAEACLVPVHPWALRHDLQQRFEKPFRSGRWRVSDLPPLSARPTMSLRTVILQSPYGDAHLKLPLAVQTTGATRTVSPAAAHNGPALSRLLQQIWASPASARHLAPLHLMAEPASFCLADDSAGQARFLAGILRQGPGASQDGARWLTPAAALLEPRHNPLFVRAADHYGLAPLALWQAYVQALLPPLTFLAGRLGLALEGHPQNVLVDFRGAGGKAPEIHFHYRDLGGIRVHPERLQEGLGTLDLPLEPPAFWPGSATCTSSLRDLASKLIYSVLQNHLGELIRATVRCTGESESPYWSFVRRVLEGCRERMGEDLAGRVFSSFWDLKAMWRMRLDAAVTEYTYAPVENPL
jgi:siderophore synthetase component